MSKKSFQDKRGEVHMYTENILLPPAYSLSKTDVYITDTRTPLVVVVVVYPEKKNGWAAIRIGISLRH
jgi:hypothetical protein